MCRKWPIYILKVGLENLNHARFLFHISNHSFCTFRLVRFLYVVLHENCCTPKLLKVVIHFVEFFFLGLLFLTLNGTF